MRLYFGPVPAATPLLFFRFPFPCSVFFMLHLQQLPKVIIDAVLPSDPTWSSLIESLEASTEQGSSNDGAFMMLSEALRERLVSMLMDILKLRATNYAKACKFDQALSEAVAIRTLAPASADSYLQEGDILSNMQCRRRAAIAVYEHGISVISATNGSKAAERLVHAKQQAIEKEQTRIDFISKLPIQIVQNHIAPFLYSSHDDDTSANYMAGADFTSVSSVWRKRLHPLARSLAINKTHQRPYQVLKGGNFKSLQRLSFDECDLQPPADFTAMLRKLGHQLTDLRLINVRGFSSIRLQEVLSGCPNLTYFRCYGQCSVDTTDIKGSYLHLRTLQFWTAAIRKSQVKQLIPAFPALEQLAIHHGSTVQCLVLLNTLHTCSTSRLKYFASNFATSSDHQHILYLDGMGLDITAAAAILLRRQSPLIDSLVFNSKESHDSAGIQGAPNKKIRDHLLYATRHIPRLNSIVISRCNLSDGHLMHFLQSLKTSALRLRSLRLLDEPGVTDRVLDDIVPRSSIQHLELSGLQNITHRQIEKLRQHRRFERFEITNCPNVS